MTEYEPETRRIFDEVLKEGDKVIIAGAHQGHFVEYCSKLVGSGKVYGFEPEEHNYDLLKKRVEGLSNVEIYPLALGDKEVTAKLYINADNDGGHALFDVSLLSINLETQKSRVIKPVEVKTIDHFFEEKDMEGLKILLLDAEGSEHAIIRGGINTIVDYDVPYIVCEINGPAMDHCRTSQKSLRSYLGMYGFLPYVMMPDGLVAVKSKEDVKATVEDGEVVFNMLFKRENGR